MVLESRTYVKYVRSAARPHLLMRARQKKSGMAFEHGGIPLSVLVARAKVKLRRRLLSITNYRYYYRVTRRQEPSAPIEPLELLYQCKGQPWTKTAAIHPILLTTKGSISMSSSTTTTTTTSSSSSRRTKPTLLQTTNTMNEEEETVSGSTSTSRQQAGLRPFIRTKSLSPMSGGGKDSSN